MKSAAPVAHRPLRRGHRALLTPALEAGGEEGPAESPCPGGGGSEPRFNSASTVSGVNGGERKRTPVASKIAFAIAAVPGTDDDSPAPSDGSPGRGMCMTSITGTSRKLRIG
ncbi:hypothetical protein D3C72_1754550 [compost metagenome]